MLFSHHVQAFRDLERRKHEAEVQAQLQYAAGPAPRSPGAASHRSASSRPRSGSSGSSASVGSLSPHAQTAAGAARAGRRPRPRRKSHGDSLRDGDASTVATALDPRVRGLRKGSWRRASGSRRASGVGSDAGALDGASRAAKASRYDVETLKAILVKPSLSRTDADIVTLFKFTAGVLHWLLPRRVPAEVLLEACRLLEYRTVTTSRGLIYGEAQRSQSVYIVVDGCVRLFHQGRPLMQDGASFVDASPKRRGPTSTPRGRTPFSSIFNTPRQSPWAHLFAGLGPSSRSVDGATSPKSVRSGARSIGAGDLALMNMRTWKERVMSGTLERTCTTGDCFGLEALAPAAGKYRRHTAVAVDPDSETGDGHDGRRSRASSTAGDTGGCDDGGDSGDEGPPPALCHLVKLDSLQLMHLLERVGQDFHTKVDVLRQLNTVSAWPPATMFRFALGTSIRRLPRHAFLFRRGMPAREVYVVISGSFIELMALEYRPEYSSRFTAAKAHAAFRRQRLHMLSKGGLRPASGAMARAGEDRTFSHRRFNASAGLDADSVPVARVAKLFARGGNDDDDVGAGVGVGAEGLGKTHRTRLRRVEVGILSALDIAGDRPLLDDTNYHTTDVRAEVDSVVLTIPRTHLKTALHARQPHAKPTLRWLQQICTKREQIRKQSLDMALFHPDANVNITVDIMRVRGMPCGRCGLRGHSAGDSTCATRTAGATAGDQLAAQLGMSVEAFLHDAAKEAEERCGGEVVPSASDGPSGPSVTGANSESPPGQAAGDGVRPVVVIKGLSHTLRRSPPPRSPLVPQTPSPPQAAALSPPAVERGRGGDEAATTATLQAAPRATLHGQHHRTIRRGRV